MLAVFSFSCHLFGIPFKIIAMGGIDLKTAQETSTRTLVVVFFLPPPSPHIFCNLYYCSEVPRILMKTCLSSFYEFPKWSFFS